MFEIRISRKAKNDLINIWLYSVEEWGDPQADLYLSELEDRINTLKQNPKLGALYKYRRGYRKLQIKSHIVFYNQKSSIIKIIRILHKRMDVEANL